MAWHWRWEWSISIWLMENGSGHTYLFRSDGCPKTGACTELFLANIHAGMTGWVGVWRSVESVEGMGPICPVSPFFGPSLSSMADCGRGQTARGLAQG